MATTTNYSWETPDDTDLVKDGAAAIRTLGSSIDTTTKALNPSTTLGDIEYRSATANTNTRLGIGSTGNVLTVAGGVPTWAAPAGGKVLQIVSVHKTDTFSTATSASFVDITGLSATITPTSATSKILAMGYVAMGDSEDVFLALNLVRGSTSIGMADSAGSRIRTISGRYIGAGANGSSTHISLPFTFLDSPNTTSATTYKIQAFQNAAGGTLYVNRSFTDSDSVNTFRQASNITLMEIGA